jgi:predicted Zn finger-like uncharacterized protein
MFKVVSDQLKISQGWVRCGHCAEVFDATVHLQAAAKTPEASQTPPEGIIMPPQDNQAQPEREVVEAAPRLLRKSADEVFETPGTTGAAAPNASGPAEAAFAKAPDEAEEARHARPAPDLDSAAEATAIDDPEDEELARAKRSVRWDFPPSQVDPDLPVAGSAIDAVPEVSFVRKARRNAFWSSGKLRAAMASSALLLAALLVLQVAVQQPADLAARYPAARPTFQWLCAIAGCELGALRRIDAVVIDSSSFNKTSEASYRLGIVLKNTADLALAMPALELTLTDTRDQALLRRVLFPADFGAGDSQLQARGQFTGAFEFSVSPDVALLQPGTPEVSPPDQPTTLPITGYRVLAFYP